jgi:hypothetical protein
MWQVRDAGAWHEVTAPVVQVGSELRPVVRGLVYDAGAGLWRRFYPISEVTITTITASSLTGITLGVPKTVSGTVQAVAGTISGGAVKVYQRGYDGGTATAWTEVGSATAGTGAAVPWSASCIATYCGVTEFKAVYGGTAAYTGSESVIHEVDGIVPGVPAKPTGGAITTTSMAFSWPAIAGVTGYSVYLGGVLHGNTVTPSYTATGLPTGTSHSWTVRAYKGSADPELGCVSNASVALVGTTSQNAVQDTGTATVLMDPFATASFRDDTKDWTQIADRIGQAYYTDSTRMYTGIIDYGGAARVKSIMELGLGANGAQRFANGSVVDARVYLYRRPNTGSSAAVTASFQVSDNAASMGAVKPVRKGTVVNVASTVWSTGKWHTIGQAHAQAIAKGTARSVALYNASSANYSQWNGKTGGTVDDCDMQVDWSWNYTLSVAVAGGWQ